MTDQIPDEVRETASFKIADHKIENLLKRLHDKRVCPCCTARALTYHGASMAEPRWAVLRQSKCLRTSSSACTRTTSRRPSLCLQRKRIEPDLAGGGQMFGIGSRSTRTPCHAGIFCARRVKSGAETTLEG